MGIAALTISRRSTPCRSSPKAARTGPAGFPAADQFQAHFLKLLQAGGTYIRCQPRAYACFFEGEGPEEIGLCVACNARSRPLCPKMRFRGVGSGRVASCSNNKNQYMRSGDEYRSAQITPPSRASMSSTLMPNRSPSASRVPVRQYFTPSLPPTCCTSTWGERKRKDEPRDVTKSQRRRANSTISSCGNASATKT